MPDLIPSEATTAGAIRQSVDGTKRCPRCSAPLEGRNPYLPSYGRYECGSYERDDTATIECYRRQLAQAKERADELQRQIDEDDDKWTRYNDLYVEARGEIVDLQLHNAQLRTALEGLRNRMKEEGLHHLLGLVNGILSSSPENPYAAVMEAYRMLVDLATRVRKEPENVREWLRRDGIVISDLTDKDQHAVFLMYNHIVDLSVRAKNLLESFEENEALADLGGVGR